MKFKLDENLPGELAEDLVRLGHDAHTVHDEQLSGCDDRTLLDKARQEDRAFLTMDKGVANVRVHPPTEYQGIVLFRCRATGRNAVLEFARRQLPILLSQVLAGHLFVATERGIRKR